MRSFLIRSGIYKGMSIRNMIKLSGQNIIFPFYHAVSNKDLPFLKYVYPIPKEHEFKADLEFLLKIYEPIHPDDLDKPDQLSKPCMLLTFDDGLSVAHEVILPILKAYAIPAVFFINTAFIDNKQLFYRYQAGLLVYHLMHKTPDKKQINKALKILHQNDYHGDNLQEIIMNVHYRDKEVLSFIAQVFEMDFSAYLNSEKPYMSTAQINALLDEGYLIGSHSVDHPLYTELELHEQFIQTIESLRVLKGKFNINQFYFSFPFTDNGIKKAFFDRIYKDTNFPVKHSFGTAGIKNDSVQNHWQRIPMEVNGFRANQVIKAEYLYYLLKMPFGRNTMRR